MTNNLLSQAKQDVKNFLTSYNRLLFNERDLQMHLALYLKNTKHYDEVEMEYFVPKSALCNYIWDSELRIDILLLKKGDYLPIELKYKTKKVQKKIERFGETIPGVEVIKNQGAQDLGMYNFWKDVRRVELVKSRFKRVKNGLVVFVTNDEYYLNARKKASNNVFFSTEDGLHDKDKFWQNSQSKIFKTHPGFQLDKKYDIKWQNQEYDDVVFHYCIIEVR